MKIALFSSRTYERPFLEAANAESGHELVHFEPTLERSTARLAQGCDVVCGFVHDRFDAGTMLELQKMGVQLIALRCAGFNNVDLEAAEQLGIPVARVPGYSPAAIAEHTLGLMLALNRKLHRAYARVREGNFALDGLLGFELGERTIGVAGTGQIGRCVIRLLSGFGCRLLAYDIYEHPDVPKLGATYVPLEQLIAESEVLTLHLPLTPETRHIINAAALARMQPGAMLINTSRGELVDTRAAIDALKSERLGSLGLDVYEEEADLFFRDLSDMVMQDDVFARLLTFPNVLITSHQAFFTREALEAIAQTTIDNVTQFADGTLPAENMVQTKLVKSSA